MKTAESSRLRVGYITNVYPAVSHSFIKREIDALEACGVSVKRWSIRPFASDLPDPSDRAEAEMTEVILARPAAVLAAAAAVALSAPLRFLGAVSASLDGRQAGLRSALVRLAHVAEAAFLVRAARRCEIDHIHAHFGTNPAAVARLARLLGGPRFSFTVHGPDEFDQPLAHNLAGKIADAAFVVAISHYGRSQLMRWCAPADWAKLEIVRCGLDRAFLEHVPAPVDHSAVPTLACVARLAPQKGLPVLVEAAQQLSRAGRAFLIAVVGDGELRESLQRRVAELGLGGHFVFHGWASADRVREVILSSRAFVLPSFAEGLPVAIMEALALCRPVITTRIAGIPELVDDGCGWLVDAGEPQALAAAMAAALDASPSELEAKGREGARRVAERHDAARNAAELYRHFVEAAGGEQR